MADETNLVLKLAEKDVERILTTTVQAQVAAAFAARGSELVNKVVHDLLYQKVDREGRPTNGTYDAAPLIERICWEQLRKSVQAAVVQWVSDHDAEMRKEVAASLVRNKKAVADQLVASLVGAAKDSYRFKVSVAIDDKGDR